MLPNQCHGFLARPWVIADPERNIPQTLNYHGNPEPSFLGYIGGSKPSFFHAFFWVQGYLFLKETWDMFQVFVGVFLDYHGG